MFKRITAVILIISITTILTGCWGKKELSEISIITAVGVDLEPKGDIRMTVISIEPTGMPSTGVAERPNAWIGTATGRNIDEAAKNLNKISSKRLVWFHNRLILIGKEVAQSGLAGAMDFFAREIEIRYRNDVMITEEKAYDILQMPADIDRNLSNHLNGLVDNVDLNSSTYVPKLKDILVRLSENKDMVIGTLKYNETSGNLVSTNADDYEKLYWKNAKKRVPYLSGSAVFRSDRMVGELEGEEIQAYLWITGKMYKAEIPLEGTSGEGILSYQCDVSKCEVLSDIKDGKINMTIVLKVGGHIEEQTSKDDIMDNTTRKKVEKSISDSITQILRNGVNKAQKTFKADIFDFGGYIYRKYPNFWRTIEKDWENIFPDINVDYRVDAVINRVGETTEPVVPGRVSPFYRQ